MCECCENSIALNDRTSLQVAGTNGLVNSRHGRRGRKVGVEDLDFQISLPCASDIPLAAEPDV